MTVSLQTPSFSNSVMSKIGSKIFMNETSGKIDNLVFWNPNEKFPSMGIGHFIWLPADCGISSLPDRFSEFIIHCTKNEKIKLPVWLQKNKKCPWRNRYDFENNTDSRQLKKVRTFLSYYTRAQTEFIIKDLKENLPRVIKKLPESMQE